MEEVKQTEVLEQVTEETEQDEALTWDDNPLVAPQDSENEGKNESEFEIGDSSDEDEKAKKGKEDSD